MSLLLWRVGVPLAALMGGLIGLIQIVSLVLVVSPVVTMPLMMGVAGMFAALAAAWAGNLLAPNRSGSRLLPIVGISEITAALLAVAILSLAMVLEQAGPSAPDLLLPLLVVSLLVLAAGASLATWRLRYPGRHLRRDALATLGLLALTVVVVAVAVYLAFVLGLVGA